MLLISKNSSQFTHERYSHEIIEKYSTKYNGLELINRITTNTEQNF